MKEEEIWNHDWKKGEAVWMAATLVEDFEKLPTICEEPVHYPTKVIEVEVIEINKSEFFKEAVLTVSFKLPKDISSTESSIVVIKDSITGKIRYFSPYKDSSSSKFFTKEEAEKYLISKQSRIKKRYSREIGRLEEEKKRLQDELKEQLIGIDSNIEKINVLLKVL